MKKGKRKLYFVLPLLLILFSTSCGQETADIQNEYENSQQENKDFENSPTSTVQDSQSDKEKVDENLQKKPTSGASKKLTEKENVWKPEEHIVTLKNGKVWGELPIIGTEDAVYCNLPENINGYGARTEQKQVLVCPDPLSGITYYVNYGRDYYIYAIKNKIAELVVEIPSKNLYCRDGKLYFMVEDYGEYPLDGLKNGDILCYNPTDGNVSAIITEIGRGTSIPVREIYKEGRGEEIAIPDEIEVSDTYMTVYQEGIYYCRQGELISLGENSYLQPEMKYCYSFENRESKLLEEASPAQYTFRRQGEKLLNRIWEKESNAYSWSLQSLTGGAEEILKPRWNVFYLVEDKAYTVEPDREGSSELIVYDILAKEEVRCPLEVEESAFDCAMFLFKDTMYFTDLYSYSFSEKKGHYAYSDMLAPRQSIGERFVMEYYTDGEQLYAISELDEKIYRLRRQEDSLVLNEVIKNITYDYKFEFLPVGE